jgi:AraC-like DNA-binding protein
MATMGELYPKQYLYRRIVRAKLYIDEHFSTNIDLGRIADEACFSKFHFTRLFREIYGITPHQYLIFVRVERAREKLARGASVKAACYGVGFDSVQSFAGLFKRRVGFTPAEFRRRREELAEDRRSIPLKYVPNCFVEKKGWSKG